MPHQASRPESARSVLKCLYLFNAYTIQCLYGTIEGRLNRGVCIERSGCGGAITVMLGNSTVVIACSNRSLAPLVRVAIPRWRNSLLAGCTADTVSENGGCGGDAHVLSPVLILVRQCAVLCSVIWMIAVTRVHRKSIAWNSDLGKQHHWGCEMVGPPCQLFADRMRG